MNKDCKENKLFQSVSDVDKAIENLSLCLKLAFSDKETFIKKYGYRMYGLFIGLHADIDIAGAKILECLNEED